MLSIRGFVCYAVPIYLPGTCATTKPKAAVKPKAAAKPKAATKPSTKPKPGAKPRSRRADPKVIFQLKKSTRKVAPKRKQPTNQGTAKKPKVTL